MIELTATDHQEIDRLRGMANEDDDERVLIHAIYRAGLAAGHCRDCCCARSWEALGITEYDGRSIPEHITALRERIATLRQPSGYAYEYPSYRGGTTIRFNGGEEVNGSKPLRAIPYVFIDAALGGK